VNKPRIMKINLSTSVHPLGNQVAPHCV